MMTDKVIALVEALRTACSDYDDCDDCPSYKWCHDKSCPTLCEAAADLIESLAAELEQVKQECDGLSIMLTAAQSAAETYKRERDAAVEDISRECHKCKHFKVLFNGCTHDYDCDRSDVCRDNDKWQWRGVKEG